MALAVGTTWEQLEKLGIATSYDDRTWFEKLLKKPVKKCYIMQIF